MDYNVIIVGGGYSGLEQARKLTDNNTENVIIIEFEAQVGGRPWDDSEAQEVPYEALYNTKVKKIKKIDRGFCVTTQDKTGEKQLTAKEVILSSGSVEKERFFDFIPGDRPSGDVVPKLGLNLLKRGYAVGLNPLIILSNEYSEELAEKLNEFAEIKVQTISLSDYEIVKVNGTSRVQSVEVKQIESGKHKKIIADAFVYANGIMPVTHSVLELGVELNKDKFIVTDHDGRSSVEGLYAYGDCAIIV